MKSFALLEKLINGFHKNISMVKFRRINFNRGSDSADAVLGPLESDILGVLWKSKEMTVRGIHSRLKNKKYALTSVAVSLDRLFRKRLVTRKIATGRGGMHYIYLPKLDKDSFEKSVVQQAVDKLIGRFGQSAVSYFNEKYGK